MPLKTLKTIMKELGHTHLTMMKVDVEGSEYHFMARVFDNFDKPPFDAVSIEFHNFNHDLRYGSSPDISVLVHLLRKWGLYMFSHSATYIPDHKMKPAAHVKLTEYVQVPPEYLHRLENEPVFDHAHDMLGERYKFDANDKEIPRT